MKNKYISLRTLSAPRRHCGFSLVELMVGIAVGLILVAGLALLFANSSRSGNELEKSIRQIENGRYAVEVLNDDLALAGFYAEVPVDGLGYSSPNVCATSGNLGWDKSDPLDVKVPLPIMGLSATQAAALPTTCLPNYKSGTAAVALHRLGTDLVAATAVPANVPHVQTSRCKSDSSTDPYIISATVSDFTLKNLPCTAVNNQVRKYVARIYYIADCNECGSDTTPTLKMAELRGTQMVAVPLVEGIESMVVEYGFDTSSTDTSISPGQPGIFRTGLSATATDPDGTWANVVAVRVNLLSRTNERSDGYSDSGRTYVLGPASIAGDGSGFKRRVYTTTVRLTNVAGPRELPSATPPVASP